MLPDPSSRTYSAVFRFSTRPLQHVASRWPRAASSWVPDSARSPTMVSRQPPVGRRARVAAWDESRQETTPPSASSRTTRRRSRRKAPRSGSSTASRCSGTSGRSRARSQTRRRDDRARVGAEPRPRSEMAQGDDPRAQARTVPSSQRSVRTRRRRRGTHPLASGRPPGCREPAPPRLMGHR
jgi:hypothetical protein